MHAQVDPPSVLPVVTVAASGDTATEAGLTTGSFTVTRNAATSAALTVYYSVGGTATAGSDYVALAGSVVIPADLVSATVTVTPLQDTIDENPETVTVTLSSNSLYTVGSPSSATVTISDDDLPVVTVVASDGTATEAGLTTGSFTVTRNAATSAALTVYYSVGGTATAGSDYVALAGSVVIPADLVSATVTVTPLQDTIDENPETVTVTLSSNSLYTVGSPSSATVTISDDDDGLPQVWVRAADDKAGEEGPTTGSFTIHRSGSTSSALTVDYSLGGTAGNGTDYASLAGSVVIPAGQSSAVVTVLPVDDTLDETNETVILTLLSRPAYSIGSPSSATVTIIDNDGVVALLANGMPTSKDACKKGGWVGFGVFKNQGDCVSYVATGGKNPPAGGGPWPVGHK